MAICRSGNTCSANTTREEIVSMEGTVTGRGELTRHKSFCGMDEVG